MKKVFILGVIFSTFLLAGSISLDKGQGSASLKLDRANVLNFPFVVKSATVAAENQDEYAIQAKDNSIIIIPTGEASDVSDLIVTSSDRETFIISLTNSGYSQVFTFTHGGYSSLNKGRNSKFESSSVDKDIKKIMRSVLVDGIIPGYTKAMINKSFNVRNMHLQKNNIFNGSKYRVEEWYVRNTSSAQLFVDEGTFYTKGVIAINLEKRRLQRNEVIKMIVVINKVELSEVK